MKDVKVSQIQLLSPENWTEYQLIDSGNGEKLESFADHFIIRPAPQAIWSPGLEKNEWKKAKFHYTSKKDGSKELWQISSPDHPAIWQMHYKDLAFQVSITSSRHIGVFPEQAPQWDWLTEKIQKERRTVKVLNLFGYTGLATLAAAKAGAHVTHVDALRKSILQGQHNQQLTQIKDAQIRWIVDDAIKFVQREARRGAKYDGIILDPPKFGRGPKGQVWEMLKLLPFLLDQCSQVLSEKPCFIILTAYAVQLSAISLRNSLEALTSSFGGVVSCGELALREQIRGRYLPMAIFSRWSVE